MSRARLILISLGVALFALMLVYSYVYKKEKEILSLGTPVKVLAAAKDIPEGTVLDETMLETVEVPKQFLQPGAVRELAEAADRVSDVPLLKGTQVLESMLRSSREEGVARRVPPEKRAFSIAVNEVSAVAGLISPGDQVDVLLTANTGSMQQGRAVAEGTITRVLLQNVLVLAVNQVSSTRGIQRAASRQKGEGNLVGQAPSSSQTTQGIRTLTLALSPEDTQKAALAQEIGSLSVALRSSWQKGESATQPSNMTAQNVLGTEKTVVPRARPAWTEFRGTEEYQLR
ncbi:MAG: Flp pilus assembly protein CpaB [Desulfovibrio sp.]|nr:Flp pilus assembly protein CpaB [Desulfovibrio sp.]MBI4958465.1 Flp pilus assembly protein CpaB [Desulfovibrio sp.]